MNIFRESRKKKVKNILGMIHTYFIFYGGEKNATHLHYLPIFDTGNYYTLLTYLPP